MKRKHTQRTAGLDQLGPSSRALRFGRPVIFRNKFSGPRSKLKSLFGTAKMYSKRRKITLTAIKE